MKLDSVAINNMLLYIFHGNYAVKEYIFFSHIIENRCSNLTVLEWQYYDHCLVEIRILVCFVEINKLK